jgi:Uma2 family endonuclease
VKKAELIEGVVYMPAAVRFRHHGHPHARLVTWLGVYCSRTPGVSAGDNSSVRLDLDNEPQPDALLIVDPEYGGQVAVSEDDYIEGSPDLVAEVAASSVSIDMHVKRIVYRRNRVREYIIWRVEDKVVDWFVLRNGDYERLVPGTDGVHHSEVFPGLWLDAAALVESNLARVLEVLQHGLASPEHAAFVARLHAARKA